MYEDHRHHHEHKHTVTEHRAPTDASIKLFDEMVAKAERHICDQMVVNDNILNFAVIAYAQDPSVYGKRVYFKFSLNGKEYKDEFRLDPAEYISMSLVQGSQNIIKAIYTRLSQKIAEVLLNENPDVLNALMSPR